MYIFRFIKKQRLCLSLDVDGELYKQSVTASERFADVLTRSSFSESLLLAAKDALSVARELPAFKGSKLEEQQKAVCTTT